MSAANRGTAKRRQSKPPEGATEGRIDREPRPSIPDVPLIILDLVPPQQSPPTVRVPSTPSGSFVGFCLCTHGSASAFTVGYSPSRPSGVAGRRVSQPRSGRRTLAQGEALAKPCVKAIPYGPSPRRGRRNANVGRRRPSHKRRALGARVRTGGDRPTSARRAIVCLADLLGT